MGRLTLWLNDPSVTPEQVVRWLDPNDPAAQVLKDDRRTRLIAIESSGQRRVVKFYRLGFLKSTVYQAVRRTPAWREWLGSQRLAAAGIRTVRPVALIHNLQGPWSQALVLPFILGETLNHHLKNDRLTPRQRATLARLVGEQVGRMTAAGIVNRDHKAANLMVDPECAAGLQPPVILDPAGLRRRTSMRQVARMLSLLHRSASMFRPVSTREVIRCLRATVRTDPSLGGVRSLLKSGEMVKS